MVLAVRVGTEGQQWERNIYARLPPREGYAWAGGRDHTPSRVPQQWGTTSCREAAPLTPHAQPGTPAVGHHQLSRGSSTDTTRPAGYPSSGAPPAVERQLHLHHTPSRVPQQWGTTSCREAAPLTPHAQPGTPAVGHHHLSRRSSNLLTYCEREVGAGAATPGGAATASGQGRAADDHCRVCHHWGGGADGGVTARGCQVAAGRGASPRRRRRREGPGAQETTLHLTTCTHVRAKLRTEITRLSVFLAPMNTS
jgi:hypothetical protein